MVKNKYTKSDCERLKHMVKNNEIIDKKHIKQGKMLIRHAKYGIEENTRIRKRIKKYCK